MPTDQNIIKVNINDIVTSELQPRKIFDEESIKELALSIKKYGILNPLIVRKQNNKYEIIAGERRYRAAKMIGLTEVPIITKEATDNEVKELALIENIQRNDLNPIEEAEALKSILSSDNITQEELSEKIGKTQSAISNKMRLLNLNQEVKNAILNGKISERHGRSLLKLNDIEQNEVLSQIIDKKLSVKATEELINSKNNKENIKNVLNSIDIDTTNSDTFNDTESEIKEKGEEKMNNNIGMGSFFPQMDNINPNINPEGGITFNNTPIDTTNINNTTIPLSTLNQEPTISTIPTEPINNVPEVNTPPLMNTPIESNINNFVETTAIEPVQVEVTPQVEPTMTMPDPPLFTNPQPAPQPAPGSLPTPEPQIIPITNPVMEPVMETSSMEKITKLLKELNDEKISYKEYSNDIENCIIISIKK